MAWNVYFFQSPRGEKIVKEFIKNLEVKTVGKVSKSLDLLKEHGPLLGMPYSKKLTKEISELRIRGKEEIRVLYTFSKNSFYLLHAFKKKTQKTPRKELKTAEVRKAIVDKT